LSFHDFIGTDDKKQSLEDCFFYGCPDQNTCVNRGFSFYSNCLDDRLFVSIFG